MYLPRIMGLIPRVCIPSNRSWSKAWLLQWNRYSPVRVVMFIGWLCRMPRKMIIIFSWQVNEVSWPLIISGVGNIFSGTYVIVFIQIWKMGYWMKSMLNIPWNENGFSDAGLGLEALQLSRNKRNLLMVLWCESSHSQIFRSCCCWKCWRFLKTC